MIEETVYLDDIKYGHPSIKSMSMMSSPLPTLCLVAAYVLVAKKLGPQYMKDRKPFNLKAIRIIYNAIQCALSTWIFYQASTHDWFVKFGFVCKTSPISETERNEILDICWYFHALRFLDFVETIILVFRKKSDRVTFRHVFLRAVLPIISWYGIKYFPDNHYTFGSYLSSMVNIFVYFYYMLESIGPATNYLHYTSFVITSEMMKHNFIMLQVVIVLLSDCYESVLYGGLILGYYTLSFLQYCEDANIRLDKENVSKFVVALASKLGNMCILNQDLLHEDASEDLKED